MLRHVVMFKWNAGVSEEEKRGVRVIREHIRPAIAERAGAQYSVPPTDGNQA